MPLEPRLIAFMGPWSEEDAIAVLRFASDLTGEEIEDFVSIGAVLDPDPDKENEDAGNE